MQAIDISRVVFWGITGALVAGSVLLLIRPVLAGTASPQDRRLGNLIFCFLPVASLALYLFLGRPDLVEWRTRPILPPFIAASVDRLTAEVKQNPTDIQAWLLLGDVDARIQRYEEAAAAYRRAAELDPATPLYKALVGQALVMAGGEAVGPAALDWFGKAKDEPLSRYYLALATAQSGNWAAALAEWQALEKIVPEGDPLRAGISRRIADARRALGLDIH